MREFKGKALAGATGVILTICLLSYQALGAPRSPGGGGPGGVVTPPPAGLAQFYPPKNKKKVYALEMIELGRALGSFSASVSTRSPSWSKAGQDFNRKYHQVAGMIPEWKAYFPAVDLPDAGSVKTDADWAALEKVVAGAEQTCTQCHVTEMFKVQALYHWPRFSEVSVVAESGDDISFHTTMVELSNNLAVLPQLAKQGDWDKAAEAKKSLGQQFGLLEQSCEHCHSTAREYFVDKTVKGRVLKMGGLLRKENKNPSAYTKLSDEIYAESCIPCHVLHMPAAFLQMQLQTE
ncbi:MAG: hypothetical protein P1V51_06785 [Deltaproteobacteria bacterium]|nr:hypothetical protein [Deltaproteobacteria bacterium]